MGLLPDDTQNIQKILSFWFGELRGNTIPKEKYYLWFEKNNETDELIKENFEFLFQKSNSGELNNWIKDSNGLLSWVVLLDQFSRNIYRDSVKAFEQDKKALQISLNVILAGLDKKYKPAERMFLYLPLEHSEILDVQKKSVGLFKTLLDESSPENKQILEISYEYAKKHEEVIERFGRFPHRNKILSRESTEEEMEFLKTPGSSF